MMLNGNVRPVISSGFVFMKEYALYKLSKNGGYTYIMCASLGPCVRRVRRPCAVCVRPGAHS